MRRKHFRYAMWVVSSVCIFTARGETLLRLPYSQRRIETLLFKPLPTWDLGMLVKDITEREPRPIPNAYRDNLSFFVCSCLRWCWNICLLVFVAFLSGENLNLQIYGGEHSLGLTMCIHIYIYIRVGHFLGFQFFHNEATVKRVFFWLCEHCVLTCGSIKKSPFWEKWSLCSNFL